MEIEKESNIKGKAELLKKEQLKEVYAKICDVLRRYCDLDEKYYNLLSLWIIGSYFHKAFLTYPYLYFNAMRGSGKTRILKLISILSKNGELLVSLSEAVLFRTAENSTFCIDEFEHMEDKEKQILRELLNAAYKKGMKVKRMKKVKVEGEVGYEVEEFNVYCPIAMANIYGIGDVQADRCITVILEKSNNKRITKKMEIFDLDPDIQEIKEILGNFKCSLCSVDTPQNIYMEWNKYIEDSYTTTSTTLTTYTGNYTNIHLLHFLNKINETSLDSRNLELFFPIFVIADDCGVLEKTIEIAEFISQSKKGEDFMENKDIALIDFVTKQDETNDFIAIKEIVTLFRTFLEEDQEDAKWTNNRWMSRALKRLNLIKKRRRIGKGIEVILDYTKAKQKIRMFREEEPQLSQLSAQLPLASHPIELEPQDSTKGVLDIEEEKLDTSEDLLEEASEEDLEG